MCNEKCIAESVPAMRCLKLITAYGRGTVNWLSVILLAEIFLHSANRVITAHFLF